MRTIGVAVLLCLHAGLAGAQSIEGYWQDTERRILYSRDAPPGYVYGRWTALDQAQTYPTAKQIRRAGAGFDLVDLLYDEEVINIARASEQSIEFTRTNTWSKCVAHHQCDLKGAKQLLCALETRCPKAGADELVWRGEVRRAQGIPHRCS